MDTDYKSAHIVSSGEENSAAAPARIQTGNLSITSPELFATSCPGFHPNSIQEGILLPPTP